MTYEMLCEIIDNSNFMIDSNNPYDMKMLDILEMQIAKRPDIRVEENYPEAGCTYYHCDCPNCGEFIYGGRWHRPHHCFCGQKLDWSDIKND